MKTVGILGGRVHQPDGFVQTDVLIEDGKIAEIGDAAARGAREVVDAEGAWVLPGGVDAHVHFNDPGRSHWEGFASGSRALAAGGGTTFIDMPLNASPPTVGRDAFELKRAAGEALSCLDFALWGGLIPGNADRLPELADAGVVGFKAFMLSTGIDDFPGVDARTLRDGMRVAAKLALPVAVHAEDAETIARATAAATASGRSDARAFLDSRPVAAEIEAVRVALELAGETGCALHVVHAGCPEVLALIAAARARGCDVSVEICYHHALLDESALDLHGVFAKCAPPLRDAGRRDALFAAILDGSVDGIGSDHSPAPVDMKSGKTFFEAWGGIMGCQHGMLLVAQRAFDSGGDSALHRVWSLGSSTPARRWGLADRKGQLTPGADADIIILRPRPPMIIEERQLLYRHRTSPYCGLELRLGVDSIFRRGEFLDPHEPNLPASAARFLKRL